MKKYCDLYYTTKVVGYKSRNNTTPIKLYGWHIREKNGKIIQSWNDEGSEDVYPDGYESKGMAETVARECIQDYYV